VNCVGRHPVASQLPSDAVGTMLGANEDDRRAVCVDGLETERHPVGPRNYRELVIYKTTFAFGRCDPVADGLP
jgi:hypothetical protein